MSDRTPPKDLLDWLGISDTPNWRVARPLGLFLSFVLFLLIFGALLAAFALLGRTIAGGFETAAGNLGAGALIVAILGAPFLVWGTVLKHKTVEFQKESHITDRISKAVEQLGEEKTIKVDGEERTVPNIEVRIGGLLSLERIAQDSTAYDKGRDHVRVMEILCAYVRENAPSSEAKDFPLPEWEVLPDEPTEEQREAQAEWREVRFRERFDANAREWASALPGPRADIAIAVKIIGRRDADQLSVEACWGPEAEAESTWVFANPCPELPQPPEGETHGREKLNAYMSDLSAWRETISGYRGYRPDLRHSNLQSADLSKLTLSGTNFKGARLEGANLGWARLDENTSLQSATLRGALWREVSLASISLTDDQIKSTFGDASVTPPDGIDRPTHWPDWDVPTEGDINIVDEWRKWQADPLTYTPPPKPASN